MKTPLLKKTCNFVKQFYLRKPPHVAYVSGWNGHDNLGDEAIYNALRQYFHPGSFVDYPKRCHRLSLRCLSKIEMALLAGGTIIGGKIDAAVHTQNCFKPCKRKIVFGTGVNCPSFWRDRVGCSQWDHAVEIWKDVLSECEYVGVRGPDSAEILCRWGVREPEIIGDPVLLYAKEKMPPKNTGQVPSIGLNVGQNENRMYGDFENYRTEFTKLACDISKAGWKVQWYVLWPKDYSLTKEIAENSGTSEKIIPIYSDHERFMTDVQRLDLFAGTRLHAVALATASYVPSVSCEYQPKCSDYMKSIQQGDSVFRTDTFCADQVWEYIRHIYDKRHDIAAKLFLTINMMRQKQLIRAEQLAAALN